MKTSPLLAFAALTLAALVSHAAMPTAFTYQGHLHDAAGPANGNHDFEFRLADAPSNSVPFASQAHYAVPVSGGVFTATPDFGSGYFNGDARWLEIGVRVTGSGASFTTLLPRTPLTATPYALFAGNAASANTASSAGAAPWAGLVGVPAGFADGVDNGADYTAGAGLQLAGTQFSAAFAGSGASDSAARSDHLHFGQTWLGASPNSGLDVRNTLSSGAGLSGRQGAGSGWAFPVTAGVFGDSGDGDGVVGMGGFRGVWGRAAGTLGENYGVFGSSASTAGRGVHGYAGAVTGATFGVSGLADSMAGTGVRGHATASTGPTRGVHGRTDSDAGAGTYGEATAAGGTTHGVYGVSASVQGRGVTGFASATNGTSYGVVGTASSSSGHGVLGLATAFSGAAIGVHGQANSTNGVGVRAESPGVALKAAGSGIIQSSATSVLYLPGVAGQLDQVYSPLTPTGADRSPTGTLIVYRDSFGGPAVSFPIQVPAVLYGQPVTLENVTIYYSCGGGNAHIYSSMVKARGESGATVDLVVDNTARTSTSHSSYTLPVNAQLGSTTAFVTVSMYVQFYADVHGAISVYGVKAKFKHD